MNTTDRPMRRVCVRLWEDNVVELEQIARTTGISFNRLVRETVRSYVTHMKDLERKNFDKLP